MALSSLLINFGYSLLSNFKLNAYMIGLIRGPIGIDKSKEGVCFGHLAVQCTRFQKILDGYLNCYLYHLNNKKMKVNIHKTILSMFLQEFL